MGLETGTYISDLVITNPLGSDPRSQGDDHIRLIKTVLKNSFPNINGAMSSTPAQIAAAATLAGYLTAITGASTVTQGDLNSVHSNIAALVALLGYFPNVNGNVGAADEDMAAPATAVITMNANWTADYVSVRKGIDGVVTVCCAAYTNAIAGATPFNIPVGFRPLGIVRMPGFLVNGNSAARVCAIGGMLASGGDLTVSYISGNTNPVSGMSAFDNVYFNFSYPTR